MVVQHQRQFIPYAHIWQRYPRFNELVSALRSKDQEKADEIARFIGGGLYTQVINCAKRYV